MKEKIQINHLPTPTWNSLRVNSATVEWDSSAAPVTVSCTEADSPVRMYECDRDEFSAKNAVFTASKDSTLTVFEIVRPRKSALTTLDFTLDDGANVKLVQLLEPVSGEIIRHNVNVKCAKDARFTLVSAILGDGDIYTESHITLDGDSSSFAADYGYLGTKSQKIDINLVVDHFGKKTDSVIRANGALMDSSEKVFRGTIDFKNGSTDATGDENETVLMLGDDVVNKTVPLILCAEENVEGSHGASIGELDDATLFYFESRGIDKEHASDIMARAAVERIARLPNDEEYENAVEEALKRQLKTAAYDEESDDE